MSIRECRRRLREVYDAQAHLKERLPPDSPHNTILRFRDVAEYLRVKISWLRYVRLQETPPGCPWACPTCDACRVGPPCRRMDPCLQRQLSNFFRDWDNGRLTKVRHDDAWFIVRVSDARAGLAQMASQARAHAQARQLNMKIDLSGGSPKLRGV